MSTSTVVIRVEDTLKDAFSEAAQASDRTASQLLRDFMRDYVRRQQEVAEHDTWFRAKVQEGLADTRPAVAHRIVAKRTRALIDRIAKQAKKA